MRAIIRTYTNIARAEGLSIIGIKQKGHVHMRLRNEEGREFTITAAGTPSDRRNLVNFRADLRRRSH